MDGIMKPFPLPDWMRVGWRDENGEMCIVIKATTVAELEAFAEKVGTVLSEIFDAGAFGFYGRVSDYDQGSALRDGLAVYRRDPLFG